MRRFFFLLTALFVASILSAQDTYRFRTEQPQGVTVKSSTAGGLKLHYSLSRTDFPSDMPELPSESRYVAVPRGATVNVEVKENGTVTLEPTQIRGLDVVLLTVTPFRYDSIQKTFEVIHDLDIDLRFEGGNGQFGESRYLNPDWEHILRNLVINGEMIPKTDYYSLVKSTRGSKEEGGEYLIIAPDNMEILYWAHRLQDFRTKQGITTKVATLSECGGNNADNIRNYILNAYNNWEIPPAAVLIFGGYRNGTGIIPYFHYTIPDEQYTTRRYPTDYPYCDMNGDSLPDLAISRITARDVTEYRTFVEKTIQYESDPPTDAAYYDRPIITAGHEDNKWFMISSQSLNGFYRDKLGKHPTDHYMLHTTNVSPPDSIWSTGYNTSVVLDYFGPNGQHYIPELIGDLHEWITKSDTVPLHTALNEGSFLTVYRGHSNFNAWWFPSFKVTSLSNIVNEPPTFVYSISCSTTLFTEPGRGIIDAFCIKEHGGAVGGIGAASLTHSCFNDILAWGVFDCIWPDFLPDFGGDTPPDFVRPSYALTGAKPYFNYHFFLPSWWHNKEQSTMHLFGYTGETYLNLFTDVPQPLQITHGLYCAAGTVEYTVTAEEGTVVCLSKDDEIIDVVRSDGQPHVFTLPTLEEGDRFFLTATKQNRFRYEYEVPVVSGNGPYVVAEKDGLLVENEYGVLHSGEEAHVGIMLHNYGSDTAGDVTLSLSCDSPFIEITQGTCQLHNIVPSQTLTLNNAFRFNVADDIPDMTEVMFALHVDDGNGEKVCHMVQRVAAPSLVVSPEFAFTNSSHHAMLQLNSEGVTDLHVQIANNGHFDSDPVNIQLELLAPFYTVDAPSRLLNAIESGGVREVVFHVDAQNNTLDEGWIQARVRLDDGIHSTLLDTLLPFGGFNETFDPGYFATHDWQASGNAPWVLTDETSYSGESSAQSGVITHSQSSSISITRATSSTEITFFKKLSSEFNYDKLHFFIDEEDVGTWSGSRPWGKVRYPLTQGTHTFRWTYTKDNSVDLGHDCAWIDDISIEPVHTPIAYSGGIVKACMDEDVSISGSYAYHYQDLEWTTQGDGQFTDPHALHPTYLPGPQDKADGGTTLFLNVDGEACPLELVLTDEIVLGDAIVGNDFIDPLQTVFSHYSVDEQAGIEFTWRLEPEAAGHIFAYGNGADVVWSFDHDITEATLTVSAEGGCSATLSKTILIDVLSTEEHPEASFTLFPNPTDGLVNLILNEPLTGKGLVEVFNLLGEKMAVKNMGQLPQGGTFSLDLSRFAPGLYIIKLDGLGKKVSLK